jgi:hypothetical protein
VHGLDDVAAGDLDAKRLAHRAQAYPGCGRRKTASVPPSGSCHRATCTSPSGVTGELPRAMRKRADGRGRQWAPILRA